MFINLEDNEQYRRCVECVLFNMLKPFKFTLCVVYANFNEKRNGKPPACKVLRSCSHTDMYMKNKLTQINPP